MKIKRFSILLLALLLVGLAACDESSKKKKQAPLPQLKGKSAVVIVAPTNYQEQELDGVRNIFQQAGVEVKVASQTMDPATGMTKGEVTPDLTWDKVNVSEFDAVVFIGGSGILDHIHDKSLLRIAREAATAQKPLAAICIAPAILHLAKILDGKRCTILRKQAWRYTDDYDPDPNKRPNYEPIKDVVRDGWVITANGPDAAEEFAREIVNMMAEKDAE